jgi:hypothetical protein
MANDRADRLARRAARAGDPIRSTAFASRPDGPAGARRGASSARWEPPPMRPFVFVLGASLLSGLWHGAGAA